MVGLEIIEEVVKHELSFEKTVILVIVLLAVGCLLNFYGFRSYARCNKDDKMRPVILILTVLGYIITLVMIVVAIFKYNHTTTQYIVAPNIEIDWEEFIDTYTIVDQYDSYYVVELKEEPKG